MAFAQARSDISLDGFKVGGTLFARYPEEIEQDAGRSTVLAQYTVMGIKKFLLAATGTAGGSNTGNGIVTAVAKLADGKNLIIGNYNLEATATGVDGRVVGTVTAGSNTGDGTVTGLALVAGKFPKIGTFELECLDANAGGGKSAAGVFAGTGNGTIGAITPGLEAIEGDYILTCIDATISGSEIFEVIDPNGVMLGNLTVAIAYLNAHFGVTIADGSTDFIVGDFWTITMTIAHGGKFKLTDPDGVDLVEDIMLPGTPGGTVVITSGGITFTITDGSTDFIVGDSFEMTVVAGEGGVWKLEDPNGNLIASGLTMSGVPLGSTTFNAGGITFTITDGSTDFIVGDSFEMTVTANGKYVPLDPTAVDGPQAFAGIYADDDIASATLVAGDVNATIYTNGDGAIVSDDKLVFENSVTLTTILPSGKTLREEMAQLDILVAPREDIDGFENS